MNSQNPEEPEFTGGLRRLSPDSYRGYNWVHWSMAIEHRQTGWLDPLMHARIREALLHALSRDHLICAAYCLMPDHGHFLIGGLRLPPESDQRLAISLFRKEWNRQLNLLLPNPFRLQKQPHDHVLRENERSRVDLFEQIAGYVLENPLKAGLVEESKGWEYLGCLIPGYPDLHPCQEDYWELFWKILEKLRVEP